MIKVFMRVMAWRLGRFAEDKILIGAQRGFRSHRRCRPSGNRLHTEYKQCGFKHGIHLEVANTQSKSYMLAS